MGFGSVESETIVMSRRCSRAVLGRAGGIAWIVVMIAIALFGQAPRFAALKLYTYHGTPEDQILATIGGGTLAYFHGLFTYD
jgi:hypothetical protein